MTARALVLVLALALLVPAVARFGWHAGDDLHAGIKRAGWAAEDAVREWMSRPPAPMPKDAP